MGAVWRKAFAATAVACALNFVGAAAFAAPATFATPADYTQEKALVASLVGAPAVDAVASARAASSLASSLPDINQRLAKLLQWVVRDYASSGDLRLLSAAPEGVNAAGVANLRLRVLQKTYWLQNNSLYGAQALLQYAPPLGRILSDSWRAKWEDRYAAYCPDTESDVVIGIVPANEGGPGSGDARCHLPRPGPWQYERMNQYPSPGDAGFDALPRPLIGTDYPGDKAGGVQMHEIGRKNVRDLLKYGCLRQATLGNRPLAAEMFDLALAQWDGNGFNEPKAHDAEGDANGLYWTRDLAFAILCANALGQGGEANWGSKGQVAKAAIEQRLWAAQSPTGGIWTNYCGGGGAKCEGANGIPRIAKTTNEISPLVLLAYGRNVWAH